MVEAGRVRFPLTEAVRISLENMRKRLVRTSITTASVTLGVAFLVSLLLLAAVRVIRGAEAQFYLYWLLFISLLMSGISITNSMLIAVAERYKEIGTYKTLGALDRHILELFLIEAVFIGVIGGLVGYAGGVAAAAVYSAAVGQLGTLVGVLTAPTPLEALGGVPVFASLLVGSLLLSTVLSLLATVYPAYHAARLNPAEALRYEV